MLGSRRRRRQNGTHHAIGLDLGSAAVKMLQLRTTAEGVTEVAAAARVDRPHAAGLGPALAQAAAVHAIETALAAGRFVGRRVAAALPRDAVQLRSIRVTASGAAADFDPLVAAEREAAVLSFPFPLSSARVAFLPAGEVRQAGETRHEVIAAAAADQDVVDFLELLARAGLDADGLDLEPAALYRAAARASDPADSSQTADGVRVVLDIGATSTQIVIGRGDDLCVVKSVPTGVRQIEDVVAKRLAVSAEDVRQLRQRAVPPPSPESDRPSRRDPVRQALHDAMRLATAALLEQATLCIRYYLVSFRGRPPARVWVTGGGADGSDLRDLARAALGLPVEPLPVMAGVPLGPLVALENTATLGEWAVAYGLALRGAAAEDKAREPAEVARA